MAFTKTGHELTKEAYFGPVLVNAAKAFGKKVLTGRAGKLAPAAAKIKPGLQGLTGWTGRKLRPLIHTTKEEIAKKHLMPKTTREVLSGTLHPLSLAAMAYESTSGEASPGEAIAGGAAGMAGWNLASRLPGVRRLGSIGRLAAGLAGSSVGYEAGAYLGNKLGPKKRKPAYETTLNNAGIPSKQLSRIVQ